MLMSALLGYSVSNPNSGDVFRFISSCANPELLIVIGMLPEVSSCESGRPNGQIVVVGGGLTGLSTAYHLVKATRESRIPIGVVLLEAQERVGGAIWTDRIDGFTLEGGADSFITNKPEALELCHELGIGDRLIGTDQRYRRSFVVRQGRPVPVPEGFVLMAPRKLRPLLSTPIISWPGKLRILMDLLIPKRRDESDESLGSFVRRRFGREALERLVQPLVGGIYTADPQELSLKAALPQFQKMEQEHGSLIRAALRQQRAEEMRSSDASGARYHLFQSLDDGMDQLPQSIAEALPAGLIRTGINVRRVSRTADQNAWRIELLNGGSIDAQAVILATEAHVSARLVDGFDPALALGLRSIPYASSAIVQLAYPRNRITHPLDGFGLVVPAIERREILAVSFLSVKFPDRAPEGFALLRVFMGGALQPHLFHLEDQELQAIAIREVSQLLGIRGEPILARTARHQRAMPQYTLGHLDRVASIHERVKSHQGLVVTGNAFSGVGVPDCIRNGREAAERALAALKAASDRAVA